MLTALCAAVAMQPSEFTAWGMETVETIRRDYRLPNRDLYADALNEGKQSGPAFNWGCGVWITALNGAARHDKAWKKELRSFVEAMRVYWNDKGPVPGYDVLPGPKDVDRYYDDNEWLVMGLTEASEILRDRKVLGWAEDTMRFVLSGEDDKLGGGIYWHEPDRKSKNTCSNAPAAAALMALYARTHKTAYLEKARELYAWTKAHLQDPEDGLMWDSISLTGRVQRTKWSYNTALMIRTAAELGKATGEKGYLDEAERMAKSSEARWIDPATGALKDEGRFGHLLLESWEYVPTPARKETARKALRWLHEHGKNSEGLYGGRFDVPPKAEQKKFELIDQASAARAYFLPM